MNASFQNLKKPSLFHTILDSLIDGVLILSDRGEWIDANAIGEQICRQLSCEKNQIRSVPQEIWRICQSLLGCYTIHSTQPIVVEDEIATDRTHTFRIRAQWIDFDSDKHPCMLVMLENRYQANQAMTNMEVKKYHLTPRETEVWLLHREGLSYKEMAAKLYISLNTVKKHMKSIYAKRESELA